MTPTDLANRAIGNLDDPHKIGFDPITLAILLAIMSAVISHYVEKCLDRLDHKTVTNPGLMQRGNLWLNCLWAARKEPGGTREHASLVYDALLKTGATMSPNDLVALCKFKATV